MQPDFNYMRYLYTSISCLAIVICAFWLGGCTYTQSYNPELNDRQQSVHDSINMKYQFEHIELQGKKTSGSGGDHNTLIINCVNGKNIPTGNNDITDAAKKIAKLIKTAMRDPSQFDKYSVVFDTRTVDGALTTNRYSEFNFNPGEL